MLYKVNLAHLFCIKNLAFQNFSNLIVRSREQLQDQYFMLVMKKKKECETVQCGYMRRNRQGKRKWGKGFYRTSSETDRGHTSLHPINTRKWIGPSQDYRQELKLSLYFSYSHHRRRGYSEHSVSWFLLNSQHYD